MVALTNPDYDVITPAEAKRHVEEMLGYAVDGVSKDLLRRESLRVLDELQLKLDSIILE